MQLVVGSVVTAGQVVVAAVVIVVVEARTTAENVMVAVMATACNTRSR